MKARFKLNIKLINIFFFLFTFLANAQEIDKLANIPAIYFNNEIRIYKDRGITNSGFIFRIFKQDNKWKAEQIQWFLPKQDNSDEVKIISPIKHKLIVHRSLEEIFMNLEALNIGFLPMEDVFEYKKEKKNVVWDDEEKQFVFNVSHSSFLDGYSYSVIYKSGEKYNEFTYNNPVSSLKKFPEIDELNSFVLILKYIRKEFKIDF